MRSGGRGDAVTLLLAAVVLGVVFAGVTWAVVAAPAAVTALDLQVGTALFAYGQEHPALPQASLVLDLIGGGVVSAAVVTVVVVVLLLLRPRRAPVAAYLVLSALGGAVVNSLVKGLVERPRPPWVGTYAVEASPSYPSGHAMAGITVYVALGAVSLLLLAGWWRWPLGLALIAFGVVVGTSRVGLGVHWATDVLGGWSLGGAWTALSGALVLFVVSRLQSTYGAPDGSSSASTVVNP